MIQFRDSIAGVSLLPAAVGSVTIDRPAAVVKGDVMVAFIAVTGGRTLQIQAPDGWTLIDRFVSNFYWNVGFCWWKVAEASEPASYTFVGDGYIQGQCSGINAYSGADPAAPIHAFVSWGDGSAGGELQTTKDCQVVWFCSADYPEILSNLRPADGENDIAGRWDGMSNDNAAISGDAFRIAGTQGKVNYNALVPGENRGANLFAPSVTLALLPASSEPRPPDPPEPPPVLPVEISPISIQIKPKGSAQFSANRAVIWSIDPIYGSINQSGRYRAPGANKNAAVTVTARSTDDPTNEGTATVSIVRR